MKTLRRVLLVVLCLLPLLGCSTSNLIHWGMDEESIYCEPEGEISRGLLKPFVTFVGVPVAAVTDVAFFPFQIIFQTYPYGDRFMTPEQVDGI